jgi:hypothetical protein
MTSGDILVWLEYNSRFTLHEDEQNRSGGIGSFYGPPLEVTILASGFLEFGERFYSPRLWTSILATRHGELEILLSKVCFRIHALLNFTRKLHPCTRAANSVAANSVANIASPDAPCPAQDLDHYDPVTLGG